MVAPEIAPPPGAVDVPLATLAAEVLVPRATQGGEDTLLARPLARVGGAAAQIRIEHRALDLRLRFGLAAAAAWRSAGRDSAPPPGVPAWSAQGH